MNSFFHSIKDNTMALFIIVTLVIIVIFLNRNDKGKTIIDLDRDCEMVSIDSTFEFYNDPFNCNVKCVCFVDESVMREMRHWIPFINDFKKIPFLFYIGTKNKKNVIKNLKDMNFPIPVFLKEKNKNKMLLICYLLDKDNSIIKITNPSISDFREQLEIYSQ